MKCDGLFSMFSSVIFSAISVIELGSVGVVKANMKLVGERRGCRGDV